MHHYIQTLDLKKTYRMGDIAIHAVDGVSFSIEKGEFVIIAGPSGAGKSTVLNILGGMDSPSGGSFFVDGREISGFTPKQLTAYRRYDVGFVFQFYNLVQNLTAIENIELATQICKDPLDPELVIGEVGLSERKNNFPSQLSGGEQQRIAIARALAKKPKLLLCDEPTGALDYNTGKQILGLLRDTCRQFETTVVVITHNLAIAPMGDKLIRIKNGRVESVTKNENPVPIERIEW